MINNCNYYFDRNCQNHMSTLATAQRKDCMLSSYCECGCFCPPSILSSVLSVLSVLSSLRSGRRSELGGGFRCPSDSAAGVLSGQPADQKRERGGETGTSMIIRLICSFFFFCLFVHSNFLFSKPLIIISDSGFIIASKSLQKENFI